jgi:hypothetical protein
MRRVYPAPAEPPFPGTCPYYGSPGLLPEASVSAFGARVCDGS